MLKRRIKVSRHEDYPNVIQLRYSQINSSMSSYVILCSKDLTLQVHRSRV